MDDERKCECGCGEVPKPGNKYINGHWIRMNNRINNPMKNPEIKRKSSQSHLQYYKDNPEAGKENGRRKKQFYEDHPNAGEENRKKQSQYFETHPEEWQKRNGNISKGMKQHPENNPMKNPEIARKLGKKTQDTWNCFSVEEKNRRVKKLSQYFFPINKTELFVLETLEYYFQGFEYTGDGSYILEGKVPDFINHEKKLIIEVFGNYWHKDDDGEDRKALFAKAGYRTLILWEDDIWRNGRTWTKEKIEEFESFLLEV